MVWKSDGKIAKSNLELCRNTFRRVNDEGGIKTSHKPRLKVEGGGDITRLKSTSYIKSQLVGDELVKDQENAIETDEMNTITDLSPLPPDGGYGWIIMFASTLINMLVDGIGTGFGMLYGDFLIEFGASKSKTALVGSLISGIYLLCGPISGALLNKYGCRKVAIAGSLLASVSLFISTYSVDINMLIITYGILTGIGLGMMYLPAIVMVGFYFEKKRALATGVAVCGSGIGGFTFSPLIYQLLKLYNWKGVVWVLSGIVLNGVVAGCLFRPLEINKDQIRKLKKEQRLKAILANSTHDTLFTQSEPNLAVSTIHPIKSNALTIPSVNIIDSKRLEQYTNTPIKTEPISLPNYLYPRSRANLPISKDCVSEYAATTLYSIPEHDTSVVSLTNASNTTIVGELFNDSNLSLADSWWGLSGMKFGRPPVTPCSSITLNSMVYDPRLPPHLMNAEIQPVMSRCSTFLGHDSYRSYPSMDQFHRANRSILKSCKNSMKSSRQSKLTISPSKFSGISSDSKKFVSFSRQPSLKKETPVNRRKSGHHKLLHMDSLPTQFNSKNNYYQYSLQSFRHLKKSKLNLNKKLRPSQSLDDLKHPFRETHLNIGKSFQEADDIFESEILTEKRIKDITNPMYRKDIFYGGSVLALPEYTTYTGTRSIVRSMTSIPSSDHNVNFEPSKAQAANDSVTNISVKNIANNNRKSIFGKFVNHTLMQMIDITLMYNGPYCLYVVSNFFCGLGFYIPSIYMPVTSQMAGDSVGQSAALMAVIGVASTVTRIMTGWISDQSWADPVIISNINLIVAGISTLYYPFCVSFMQRITFCIFFGTSTAGFICLRSIIMVRLVGLSRLTNAFGLLCMTQGIAALIGPPLAGALYDHYQIYDYAFYMSGTMLLISGTMCLPLKKLLRKYRELDQRARLAEVLGTTIDLKKPVYLHSLIMDVHISDVVVTVDGKDEADKKKSEISNVEVKVGVAHSKNSDVKDIPETEPSTCIDVIKDIIGKEDILKCEIKIDEVNIEKQSKITKGEFIITTKVQDQDPLPE